METHLSRVVFTPLMSIIESVKDKKGKVKNMNKITESYNKIVDTMNDLGRKGYSIVCSSGCYFYINLPKKLYVECFVVDPDVYSLKLMERTTKYGYDCVNDNILKKVSVTDYKEVGKVALELIQLGCSLKREFLKLLKDFKTAYNNIVEFCNTDEDDTFNKYACDNYPFDKSFDEIPIDDWVNSVEEKMQKDKLV